MAKGRELKGRIKTTENTRKITRTMEMVATSKMKRALDRGARTVEVLKQGQYQPMPVEQQVMIIFAVTNGFLDDVPVAQVREWERGFHEFIAARFPQIGERIRTEKTLSKETEGDLRRGIEEYKRTVATPETVGAR